MVNGKGMQTAVKVLNSMVRLNSLLPWHRGT